MIDWSPYRRAYELGRLRYAVLGTAVAAVPLMVAQLLGHPLPWALAALFLVVFATLRWWGGWCDRAATVGLAMGVIPFAVPVALSVSSRVECPPYCEPLCAVAGLVAGVGLGSVAQDGNPAPILAGTALAILVGMLGCTAFGATAAVGMACALVVGVGVGRLRTA